MEMLVVGGTQKIHILKSKIKKTRTRTKKSKFGVAKSNLLVRRRAARKVGSKTGGHARMAPSNSCLGLLIPRRSLREEIRSKESVSAKSWSLVTTNSVRNVRLQAY